MASYYIRTALEDRLEPYHLEGDGYSGGILANVFHKAAVMSVSHNISFEDLGSFLKPDTCDTELKDYNNNHNDRASDMQHDSYLLLGIVLCQVGFIHPACLCAIGEHLLSSRVVMIHKLIGPHLCGIVGPRLPLRFQSHPDSD